MAPALDLDLIPGDPTENYQEQGVLRLVQERLHWLLLFFVGLVVAALVVDEFNDVLEKQVQLSFFVPLVMGHGGNTGSQAVTSAIRALALKQVKPKDAQHVVVKEAISGAVMGALLGSIVFAASLVIKGLSSDVGVVVAVALPLVSMWANACGSWLTFMADRYQFNPALTAMPLMSTIIDATGLLLYFYIAKLVLGLEQKLKMR